MRLALALAWLLLACAPKPQPLVLPGDLPPVCAAEARLPRPPAPPRTFSQTTDYARAAAMTALWAIHERDQCAENYARLYRWAEIAKP